MLYKRINFLIFLLSDSVSQPVSNHDDLSDENISSPITKRAAFGCTCSNMLTVQPSRNSEACSNNGRIYVQYSLLMISLGS